MIDKQAYLKFLQSKVRDAGRDAAVNFNLSLIHPSTKAHQRDAIVWALRQQRALIAASFGLGKTQVETEIARLLCADQPQSKFLLVAPLGVRQQFTRLDGPRLGVDWQYVYDDASLAASTSQFCITNYERLRDGNITPSKHDICGVSLDEGSVLRSLGSKTVDVFMNIFHDVPYRFVATATPSPNSYRELLGYADFLGVMDRGQALTRWFMRNPQKAGDLQLHPQHAQNFWMWMATWALFIYKPSDLGYSDEGYELPELQVQWHRLSIDHSRAFGYTDNRGQHKLLVDATGGISELAREKRATLPARIEAMQTIITASAPDTNFLLWHDLEDERRAIEKAIPEAKSVYGTLDLEEREQRIIDFSEGRLKYLATKPELSGSGCNFQYHCHTNVFLGVGYKFEDFIQAIHRTYRFQQRKPVQVHVIYAESEEPVVAALKDKWKQHDALVANMRAIIREHGLDHRNINEALKRTIGVQRMQTISKTFQAANNDCVLEMEHIADDSVGLIHTSIPFGNHYEYSVRVEDFGHNDDNGQFFAQMDFLIPQLLRVLKPGRVAAVHVKDRILYGHQTTSGIMEVDPFSDLTVAAFRRHGFLYEGRRTIVTDVVRENNSTYRLGWTEMTTDASKMGSGLPEYLLLFRKPPTSNATSRADEPVAKLKADYTRGRWQLTAHSFWRSDGNVLVPSAPAQQVEFLVGMLAIKDPYDFEAHVSRLEDKDRKGHLPASFLSDPPTSNNTWCWDDIVSMRCLNSEQSQRKQRNHICPLPLDIVERTIDLYSNPGEVVLDPFAGLFTVPYVAIKRRRIGWGIELSTDYFADGVRYCQEAEAEVTAPTLFDLLPDPDKETA